MAGLNAVTPTPTEITLHQTSRTLEVAFADGARFSLRFEFLRVHSPSAEVQGHSPDQAVLQTGKRGVTITALEQVGNYAVQPTFSDGHHSGIYSWAYLHDLGLRHDALWQRYLATLERAGASRDSDEPNAGAKA
jgi:DUF971 family protein